MKYYAGIGSRQTPPEVLQNMTWLASLMKDEGYILRSGGAIGADRAFEHGAGRSKEIIRWQQCTLEAEKIAESFHPAWHLCTGEVVRKLLGRNAQIILGKDLKTPVEFVLCWTPFEDKGGTSLGIKIARFHKIPVYNLYNLNRGLDLFADELVKRIKNEHSL